MIGTCDEHTACQECSKFCEDAGDLTPVSRKVTRDESTTRRRVYSAVFSPHGIYYRIRTEAGTPLAAGT